MEYIRRNCNPVTLDAVHQFMDQEILLPDRSIAVTFDDGYQSVYQEAFPILREFRIPATVFVVTNLKVGSAETTHSFPVLTWGQMQAMQNSGLVTFGAHGHTHRSLDLLSGEEAKNEIENSMALVVGHLGVSPKFFSYPRGRFSDAVKRIVKDVGFLGSVSTKQGLVSPGDDVYQIKRVEINRDISFSEFRVRLTQAIDWLTFFWRKYHGFG
ncbi:MAG: polysaccharide deacetylase family protein [Candidatus Sungbacteria bacterium]|nr:polysaccharide deacetylase family protein [Candidatus Sungbacteria bacterium]